MKTNRGVQVDERRIWDRLMQLAEFGRSGETGVNRAAFSVEDVHAKRAVIAWASSLGVEVRQDEVGNLFLRYAPAGAQGPAVMTGSHLDSQPTGGRFDGAYGVVAALEVIEALNHAGAPVRRPIEVVAWSNEEGSRFAPGAMGSQYFAGLKALEDLLDVEDAAGKRLQDALEETLRAVSCARTERPPEYPCAYVEAHIEQGPVLEERGSVIGTVEGIQGCAWLEFEIVGAAAHAGTTPLHLRRDALRSAMRFIDRLESGCRSISADCRFTVGRLSALPGSPNTVPGQVRFTLDLRDVDTESFEALKRLVLSAESMDPVRMSRAVLLDSPPCRFDEGVIGAVSRAATRRGFPQTRLVSGAFHDALSLAGICRTGMIFVPSKSGISHHPDEYSAPAELAAGAQVLADVVLELANQ